jgi:hypothetical protein
MPDQDDLDAMIKAWTYAVLDAAEAADEKTRLEIARILCPAGFVIIPTESKGPTEERKTKVGQRTQTTGVPRRDAKCRSDQLVNSWMPGRTVVGPDDDSRHGMSSDGAETPATRRDRRERPDKSGKTHG